jgi:hypothetical protein
MLVLTAKGKAAAVVEDVTADQRLNPAPHRPDLASGRFANGYSWISRAFSRLKSSCRLEGVKPFRVLAT